MRIEKDFLGAREIPDDAYYGVFQNRGDEPEPFPTEGEPQGRVPQALSEMFMGFRLAAEQLRQ